MFHNGEKRKPLNFIFYCYWLVQVSIITINIFFIRRFIQVSINIFFIRFSIKINFPFLKQCRMIYISSQGYNICTKYFNYHFLFIVELCLNIERMKTLIYRQDPKCIWCGGDCVDTCHDFVWIIYFFCMNCLFYIIWKFCQIIIIAFQNSKSFEKYYSNILLGHFNMKA